MITQDLAAKAMAVSEMLLAAAVGDFSDDELYTRPVPGANHAAWQLGHLVASQYAMVSGVGGKLPALPEGFQKTFNKQAAANDGIAAFGYGKEKLLGVFKEQRAAAIAWVKSLKDEQLATPGPEPMRAYIPTIGDMLLLLPNHDAMHLGQLQVIRRKLGKKHLM